MIVYLNNSEVEIFSGAKVVDLILTAAGDELGAIRAGKKYVVDEFGNRVSLEGELNGFEILFIKED